MKFPKQPRRTFIKQAVALAGMPMIIPGSVLGLNGAVAPSNRVTVGGIGLGRRGRKVLESFFKHPDFQFLAIADPDKEKREIVQRLAMRKHGVKQCDTYVDMGDVLTRDDIDAVLIATGDRWHATASIYAARAGKDIYCEKPCAMNIQESRELDEAVLENKRVFQAGTQRRALADDFRGAGVHRNRHIHFPGQRLHHRANPIQLLLHRDRRRAGAGGLAAHINKGSAFGNHALGLDQSAVQPVEMAAIGK